MSGSRREHPTARQLADKLAVLPPEKAVRYRATLAPPLPPPEETPTTQPPLYASWEDHLLGRRLGGRVRDEGEAGEPAAVDVGYTVDQAHGRRCSGGLRGGGWPVCVLPVLGGGEQAVASQREPRRRGRRAAGGSARSATTWPACFAVRTPPAT